MQKILFFFLTVLFFAATLSAQQLISAGSHAPQFSLAGLDGRSYDLSKLRGKVVLVTFWSTRCNICHSEIPQMNRLAARYKNQNVVFLGLTMDNDRKVTSYLRNNDFDFTIVPNSFGVVLQYADRDRSGNINMGFPAHFLVDQNGVVRLKTSGWDKTPAVDFQIGRLLGSGSRELAAAASARQK
jgi:peroxiredoxin